MPGQHDGCDEPGCYSDKIVYDATMEQIENLIEISENCEQSIINNCTYNRFGCHGSDPTSCNF